MLFLISITLIATNLFAMNQQAGFVKVHYMDPAIFCEEIAQGTIFEETTVFTYATYQNAISHAQKSPSDLINQVFLKTVYFKELPDTFDQFDTLFCIPAYLTQEQEKEIKRILKNVIGQKAQEKHCSSNVYFNDLKKQLHQNRKNLISALEKSDYLTLDLFKKDRTQNPWNLMHILPESDWKTFKAITHPI